MYFLRIKSQLKFCHACKFSFAIFRNSEKIIGLTMSLHAFPYCLPLQEIGRHIATDFSVTRRSTIVVDSFIAPIDEDASCMQYTISFCDEESSGIVCFKCFEEMLVVAETIMREFITSSCLLEELIKGLEISFISVSCIMRDKSRRDTAFLGESDIISSFFRKARKELLFVYSEVQYSCHRLNKSPKWSRTLYFVLCILSW